ncbi:MAG: hypothetical protein HQL97_03435 [Magnetococcales bacterium]|nr:hypothetical protein [Magnetococcales bacterium]
MAREKKCDPTDCDLLAGEVHARIDHLYQRQAKLLRRMDELERATREQLDRFAAAWPSQMIEGLAARQEELSRRIEEQEEESSRIYANQNDLLLSLDATLNDIRQRIQQIAERQESLSPSVAAGAGSE